MAETAEARIRARIYALRDEKYREFHLALIPTVDPATVVGVRSPALRALAKELRGTADGTAFLRSLPHGLYEERNLHSMLIALERDFNTALEQQEEFLPHIDNWATCDLPAPRVFARHTAELLPHVRHWLQSDHPYTVRYGVRMLMDFYLGEAFTPEKPALAAACAGQGEYYVDMALAWYFAEGMAKQPAEFLPWLEQKRLRRWTHNKAIQKSCESYRVPAETKAYLKTLRVKNDATGA